MGDFLLGILYVADVLTVLLIVLAAGTSLRDEGYRQGWLTANSRLGRMAQRSERKRTYDTLQALGLDAAVASDVRAGFEDQKRKREIQGPEGPDVAFLNVAQPWVLKLTSPVRWRDSGYYLDIMGAIGGRRSDEQSLGQIHADWVRRLQGRGLLPDIDLLLGPKDGNVLLCQEVAQLLNVRLILCKGEQDKSRVIRPGIGNPPHETDFEGLSAFVGTESRKARMPGYQLNVAIIDDSCASGSQLVSVASRFNRLAAGGSLGPTSFRPVEHVVTLFRVQQSRTTDNRLKEAGLSLHALVAVGDPEMKRLFEAKSNFKSAKEFKRDVFGCADSVQLFDTRVVVSGQETSGTSE